MGSRAQTIENLNTCFDDLESLIDALSDDEWDVQSLCPDWTVRGIVTHLAAIEYVLMDWMPTADDGTPPFAKVSSKPGVVQVQ